MEFVDNSGHIFSLPSYDDKPIGYEFEENKYTFWIDSDTNTLSINNYYMRTINVLIPIDYSGCYKDNNTIDGNIDIAIECDSNVFSLVSSIDIQNMISNGLDIKDNIKISNTKKILTNKDLVAVHVTENSQDFALIPIYVIGYTEEPGTWSTNLLIRTTNKLRKLEGGNYKYYYVLHETDKQHKEIWYESFGKILYEFSDDEEYKVIYESSKMIDNKYCSITVGGIFKDESEELTINGLNTGVSLPLDMFRSVYQTSFYNHVFDEQRYNEKLKEYLTNFMSIKGELGNFKSAENSIKWFGWGDKISVSKLLQTDNVIQSQYIKDHFTISTGSNILESFDTFRNSTLLSIIVKLNTETGDLYDIDFNEEFYGEGNPKLENLIDKLIPETVGKDKNEQIEYWKGYYDYTFYELGLKLSCLKYYYEKYFLPIHLSVNSASLQHKVYLNDVKFINKQNTQITEKNINIEDDDYDVEFPSTGIQYLTEQVHFVDSGYHEYNSIGDNDKEDWYYLHDTCICVPIKFNKFDKYYNCTLLLEKHNKDYTKDHEYPYFMTVDYNFTILDDIKIYDYYNKLIDLDNVNIAYKTYNDDTYSRYYKGISSLIETVKNNNSYIVPIKLVDYENSVKDSIKDSIVRYKIDLENIKTNNVLSILRTLSEDQLYLTYKNANKDDNINPYIETTYKCHRYVIILPSISSSNVNVMNNNDITGKICIIPELNYKIQYKYSELEDFKVNNKVNNIRILDKVHINFVPTSTLIYEDHFSFVQDKLRPRTQYRNFVIYPKNINKKTNKNIKTNNDKINDINYWLDNDFTIRLLVNNKWYRYDFKVLLPELSMNIGTLQYKYWANSNNYLTPFSQLKSIGSDHIEFNSFMWEPKLATTNEINFIDDLIKYVELYNLKYVDGTYIDNTGFYEYIKLGNQTIRLRSTSKRKNFILNKSQLSSENVYVYLNENNIYILDEIGTEGIYDVSKYPNGDYLYQYEQQDSDIPDVFVFEDSTECDSILFIYDIDKNGYYMKRISSEGEDNNNWIEDKQGNRIFLSIGTIIHNSLDDFLDRYTQHTNITNNKYLNRIHIFDLMKVNNEQNDVLYLHDNILLRYGDLSFKHDRTNVKLDNPELNNIFDSTKSIEDHKLYIFKNNYSDSDSSSSLDIIDTSRDLELVDDWIHGNIKNIDEDKLTDIDSQYEYVYFVLRDKDYNDMIDEETGDMLTSINALNNIINKSVYIGTAIYDSFNEFKNHNYMKLSDDFNKSIYKSDDNFIIEDENGTNLVYFKVKFLYQDGSELELTNNNYITFAKNIFNDPDSKYLIKVEFYYNKHIASVPNRFVKVNNDKVFKVGSKYYTTINNKDQEVVRRYNINNDINSVNSNIYENQPGIHWYDIDTNLYEVNQDKNIQEFLDKLNISPQKQKKDHLQRTSIVNDKIENFFIQDDTYTQQNTIEKIQNDSILLNEVEYVNWLKKSIPVVKGTYKVEYTVSNNQESNIKMLVCVYDTESKYKIYTNGDKFELTGNEYKVETHFVINTKDLNNLDNIWIDPHVYKLSSSEQNNYSRVLYTPDQYDKEDCGTYTVHVKDEKYDNKYRYGNNNSKTVIDMYNKFFKNVYYDFANVIDGQNIYDDKIKSGIDYDSVEKSMTDDDKKNIKFEHKREIIIEQKLKLDSYLDYDLYLMHDYEYWYVMFISKQTIDEARNIDDLNIRPDQVTMFLKDKNGNIEYKIDHVRSDNQFLPNRMKFVSSNGVNHFNTNDIIAAYLQNNNRLPVNSNIGSKWTISPMSIGINIDQNTTKSSAEMTILNGTKGDNYYRRGYYNVTCQYCIDRNTQKEFIKKANIRIG